MENGKLINENNIDKIRKTFSKNQSEIIIDRESTRQWGHKKSFVLYVCPTFVVVAATATAAAAAAAAAVVVVAGQLDICGPIFRFATSLLLLWIFPFPARSVTLLPLSVDPFALSRTAWHTRGQRNDGMGRDGTSEDRG